MILHFSLVISLVCNKDTDIEGLAPASVFHRCLVLAPYLDEDDDIIGAVTSMIVMGDGFAYIDFPDRL